jgi:hypothetical protein
MAYELGEDMLGEDLLGEDLLGEDLLGEDILGEDLLGDDILGAVARPRMTARQRRIAPVRAMQRARVRQSQAGRGVAMARMPGGARS